ncbi:endonuclease [Bacillus sp. JJ1122]|uniref:endonuclease I family protein n=1 Tax=Bacillus sp. JJ1122 TaxID=3122951 RepID=UPI002FFFA32C
MIKLKTILEEWISAKDTHIESINNKVYYDCALDQKTREEYYSNIHFEQINLADEMNILLVNSHTNPLRYSPHQYVYPWVDLQENLQLKSLYSGQNLDPLKTIEEDLRQLKAFQEAEFFSNRRMIYNCEHVVPQSWFGGNEPMKGDLHHLFACEPACNSMRNNFPYHDYQSYTPELAANGIRTGCGMAENGGFEPEYGKGISARAVFYFTLRYKGVISLEDLTDLELLHKWHQENPVTLYEKHRNAAIQELQGNRNPFIDFPEHAEKMLWM